MEVLNAREVSEKLGVSRQAIHKAIQAGRIREVKRERGMVYVDLKECQAVLLSGKTGGVAYWKERYEKARALRAEWELSRDMYEWIEYERVVDLFEKAGQIASKALFGLPNKLAPRLAAESDPRKIYDILDKEIADVLDEMNRNWNAANLPEQKTHPEVDEELGEWLEGLTPPGN